MQAENQSTQKVALITGASRGIGRETMLALAKMGHCVIGTATSASGADTIATVLSENNLSGTGMVMDVTEPDSIHEVMAKIKEQFSLPLILVNNAGITQDNLFLRMKAEQWLKVIDTDLNAIYRVSQACIKGMMKAKWGRIISIGSVVASSGNPGQANYCAAKAGVIGFSKSLAQELAARNITVNVIAPGFIKTDMTAALNEEQAKTIMQAIPMGEMGLPEDIAASAVFLASDAARYITGQTIHVNGGMYMN